MDQWTKEQQSNYSRYLRLCDNSTAIYEEASKRSRQSLPEGAMPTQEQLLQAIYEVRLEAGEAAAGAGGDSFHVAQTSSPTIPTPPIPKTPRRKPSVFARVLHRFRAASV